MAEHQSTCTQHQTVDMVVEVLAAILVMAAMEMVKLVAIQMEQAVQALAVAAVLEASTAVLLAAVVVLACLVKVQAALVAFLVGPAHPQRATPVEAVLDLAAQTEPPLPPTAALAALMAAGLE